MDEFSSTVNFCKNRKSLEAPGLVLKLISKQVELGEQS